MPGINPSLVAARQTQLFIWLLICSRQDSLPEREKIRVLSFLLESVDTRDHFLPILLSRLLPALSQLVNGQ